MCGARGPWPSSSCASCRAIQTFGSSSRQAPRAAIFLVLNPYGKKRSRRQSNMRNVLVEATEKIMVGKRDDSFASFPLAPMNESSFLKGTSLRTGYKRSPSQNAQKCTVTLINLMVSPTMSLEKLAVWNSDESEKIRSLNIEKAVWMKRPQLEIRRPGYSGDEVDMPVVKLVHPVDSHSGCLRVKPKLQVRPSKNSSERKHGRSKLPRFLPAHRESRPRNSKGAVSSPAVYEVVESLRRSWFQHRSIEDAMEKFEKTLSPRDISCVLTELQRQHNWQITLEVFYWIKKQPWHRPNSRLYTRLIGFLGREGQVERATVLLQEMLLEKCRPDQYTFTALVNGYGKARMLKDALAVFNYMKECPEPECQPNTVTCNALLDALVKGGQYDLALTTFFDMRNGTNGLEHGCKPNVVTYNILIDALCKEGLVEIGVRVLHHMRKEDEDYDSKVPPNSATYNTLINACGKIGLYEKAEDLMEEMVQHGVQPDRITYTALIDAYGKAGLWEAAENTFKGMTGASVSADVMTYTAMIDAYAKEGLHDKAEEIFKMMQQSGIRPNQVTYLSLIDAYGKGGLPEEAKSVFAKMQAAGYEGNVLIYSALINAYGKAQQHKKAADMLELMRLAGCQPNLITYAAVFSSCGRCKSWDDALELLQVFENSQIKMEQILYKVVRGSSISEKLWEDVSNSLEKVVTKQPKVAQVSFFNSLIEFLWSCGLCGRAARVLSIARAVGVYNDDKCTTFTKSEWCLDLHRFSVGAAMTMLVTWLEALHLAWVWGEDPPETIVVVTGKGKHSKNMESALKAQIESQLSQLSSPFTQCGDNSGRLSASGTALQDWLLSPGIKQRLSLVDTTSPRPSYNNGLEK